ncbi:hypothetical protein Mterra_00854 [Calidithermus terrae]|uniref:Uncharacterized protein n=1 Tax=Calidithermus terrae TaxID=1408545 RepID=A0A399EYR0_9DEIN|nr:hypothetical protein Mterra_00854 [Calidithermus terrae]
MVRAKLTLVEEVMAMTSSGSSLSLKVSRVTPLSSPAVPWMRTVVVLTVTPLAGWLRLTVGTAPDPEGGGGGGALP